MTQSPANTDEYFSASPSWGGGVFEILFILIVFICILFLAYIVTRFVANRAVGRLRSRHMEVVDTLAIGGDSQLMVVKIGGEYLLISKSQKLLTFLTKLELTPEELEEAAAQPAGFAENFRTVLEGKLGLPPKRQLKNSQAYGESFRDNIDKIKNYSDTREGGQDE